MHLASPLVALITILSPSSPPSSAQDLEKNLPGFSLMVASDWSGRMVSFANGGALPPNLPMAAPGYYIVRWEKLLGGRVIQELRSNSRSASEVTRVTYFWDFRNAQVAYLAVTPRTLDRGTIREDQGKIIRTGTLTFANDSVDYVETWEVTPAGKLIQRYVPAKGNGHVLEMEKAASAATR